MQFVGGIIIGFIGGWAFDSYYWQRRRNSLSAKLINVQTKMNQMIASESRLQESLLEAKSQIQQLEADLSSCQEQSAKVLVEEKVVVQEKDNLEKIRGIGAVFSQKLYDAGIYTYAQLASQTSDRLYEIINPESWQKVDFDAWLAEANTLMEAA